MFYAGRGSGGPVFLSSESHLLVLGPPRTGKTRSIVIPNISIAPGPVIATSTKSDLIDATYTGRAKLGNVSMFDPSGTISCPQNVERIYWSPIDIRGSYSDALSVTRAMVDASVLLGGSPGYSHWIERASSLVAPLIHAAQIAGFEMDTVMNWLQYRDCKDPCGILRSCSEDLALDSLSGVLLTEDRERSGIFSTAVGLLSSYSYPELHAQSNLRRFDARQFLRSQDTLYLISPSHIQKLVAPVIVGLIDEVKNRSFVMSSNRSNDSKRLPVSLILDEMANVAPLGSISSILSEGASQKVLLLGALQDLSQARVRWGDAASGFVTLFGSTLVLPGIADIRSLNQFSEISGKVAFESLSRSSRESIWGRLHGPTSSTKSVGFQKILEPWQISSKGQGFGYLFRKAQEVRKVEIVPYLSHEPISRSEITR